MAAFEYEAVNSAGKTQKGTIEADTPRQARQLLRDQALIPVVIKEITQRVSPSSETPSFWMMSSTRLSTLELALLTRQLATLLSANLPLEESLASIAQRSEQKKVRSMLAAIRAKVVEGHPLAYALNLYPQVFSELYRATVHAGEQSGFLAPVLSRLADYTENSQRIRNLILKAIIYPVILTLVAILVVVALLIYVIPKVVEMFEQSQQALPALTQALINISDFLMAYGIGIGIGLVIGIGAFRWSLRQSYALRLRWQRLFLFIPLASKLIRSLQSARFMRTFAMLSGSGVPILQSLSIAGEVLSYLPMKEAVAEAALRVKEGAGIAASLEKSKLFPGFSLQLIASGEAAGELEQMLAHAAVAQERESEMMIGVLLALFEPLLILVMGMTVLIIVLAIIAPLLQMNQLV